MRIRSDASAARQRIKDIPLRLMTGVSILAVSRGGRVYYDPQPDFKIFPGDRLLIMGPPAALKDAERVLNKIEMGRDTKDGDRFEIAEVKVADDSKLVGLSLVDLRFRQKYGLTLVGIRRGKDQIVKVNPSERLLAGDCLILFGTTRAVGNLKKQEPL
jgi:uncharacterized protein with PhoU and TrkA domain